MCLSTGDIVKIIRIDLLAVYCEDISTNEKFELPLTHTGENESFDKVVSISAIYCNKPILLRHSFNILTIIP